MDTITQAIATLLHEHRIGVDGSQCRCGEQERYEEWHEHVARVITTQYRCEYEPMGDQ